jgi:hypothetical protein
MADILTPVLLILLGVVLGMVFSILGSVLLIKYCSTLMNKIEANLKNLEQQNDINIKS